jgi:MFS family permease
VLQDRRFLAFWVGFTISATGDAMTRVALVWYVLGATRSSEALGWLAFCSTAPVIVGGLVAGWLLDRFERHGVPRSQQ